MLNQFLKELSQRPCLDEFSIEDWLKINELFNKINDSQKKLLVQQVAAHAGLSVQQTSCLSNDLELNVDSKTLFTNLSEIQKNNSNKIKDFLQYTFCKNTNLEPLAISRAEWLAIINKFEQQNRTTLGTYFFLNALSVIRGTTYNTLRQCIAKPQPRREVKQEPAPVHATPSRQRRYKEDGGVNPIIWDPNGKSGTLQSKLTATGVRATTLTDASPEKGYRGLKSTPGGSKARLLCSIGDQSFFKALSPYGKQPLQDRVDARQANKENIRNKLPRLTLSRATTVHFTATLEKITDRSGQARRIGQKSLTKASVAQVFEAHGISVRPSDGRHHHWAHLIAYFLGGELDTTNMVPSTAAANYNTLEAVELFIKNKILSRKTPQINIKVEPHYSGDSLIPDMLTYQLNWQEGTKAFQEYFCINPQSYQRITKSMHQSIDLLREEESQSTTASM